MMETRGDEDITAEDFAQKVSAKFEKKTVRGLQKLASKEVTHPVTGDKVYVAVFGLNAGSAKAALEVEKINYATKVMDNRHQTVERGRAAANAAAVKASENRADDFQKGASEQSQAIVDELKSRKPAPKPAASKVQGSAKPTKTGSSTGGAFLGDTDVGDDF